MWREQTAAEVDMQDLEFSEPLWAMCVRNSVKGRWTVDGIKSQRDPTFDDKRNNAPPLAVQGIGDSEGGAVFICRK